LGVCVGGVGFLLLGGLGFFGWGGVCLGFFGGFGCCWVFGFLFFFFPVDYKIEVTLDMFEELTKYPNVQAIKESTRDVSNVTRLINRFGDRFKIFTGVDPLAMESIVMGAHGWVAGLVDAFPRETVAIFNLIKENRIAEALTIYRWFLPVLELDIHPKLVQYIKLAEVATGLGTETVRAPRLAIEGEERERVLKIINDALAVRPELPAGSWGK
jgi:4-hydroxy-tetrahydrodipicolinate synthase